MLTMAVGVCIAAFATRGEPKLALIDPKATRQTRALFSNLKKISRKGILFGHQSATEYGHGWSGDADRSDVKSVVGSHPAVIGIDFGGLCNRPEDQIEAENFRLRKLIVDTYDRGGVTTVCCHMSNPVTGGGFNATAESGNTVQKLLPGGSHNAKLQKILFDIADLAKRCRGKDGNLVPIIFRPWHEFDGDWFW